MNLQESGEMYLETIYVLSQKYKDVRAIDVGEYMGYSKPSVSRSVRPSALRLCESAVSTASRSPRRYTSATHC
mgnify:CR=1 FL=1